MLGPVIDNNDKQSFKKNYEKKWLYLQHGTNTSSLDNFENYL